METAERQRYVYPITRPAWQLDAAIAFLEELLLEPVLGQRLKTPPKPEQLMEVAVAVLRWTRGQEATTDVGREWHTLLDSWTFNGAGEALAAELMRGETYE